MTAVAVFFLSKEMSNTDIKWFSFDNANAPQLSNTWGCLIDVLDACLVNGFGPTIISSLNITDGVATATFNNNHSFKQFQVIEISGADEPLVNKEFKVLGLTRNTIEFVVDLPDQVATGSMVAKLASAGWDKVYSGEQKAVYQAKDKVLNPYFLRVDNSLDPAYNTNYAKYAKVGVLEACSGIDDVSQNQTPFDTSNLEKNWVGTGSGTSAICGWFKWKYALHESGVANTASFPPSNGDRNWIVLTTKDSMYLLVKQSIGSNFESTYGFGVAIDDYNSFPFLIANNDYASSSSNLNSTTSLTDPTRIEVAGLYGYGGVLLNTSLFKLNSGFGNLKSGSTANTIIKNPVSGYGLTPFYLIDPNNYILGELPLVKCCINNATTESSYSIHSDDSGAYIASRYRVVASSTISQGTLFFKIH